MPFIGVQPASALLTSADIQDRQITTAKIADTAVTTAKITDDAVTGSKIENSPTIANGITLTDGNITLASGHGLDFSATSDGGASTPTELFDDYEEGTWTPTGGSNAGTLSFSDGRYTKIGQVVYVTAYIVYTGATTSSSANRVYGGLPFTVNNWVSQTSVDFQGSSWANHQGAIYFDGGSTEFIDSGGSIRSGSFQADNNTRFQGFYFTAS